MPKPPVGGDTHAGLPETYSEDHAFDEEWREPGEQAELHGKHLRRKGKGRFYSLLWELVEEYEQLAEARVRPGLPSAEADAMVPAPGDSTLEEAAESFPEEPRAATIGSEDGPSALTRWAELVDASLNYKVEEIRDVRQCWHVPLKHAMGSKSSVDEAFRGFVATGTGSFEEDGASKEDIVWNAFQQRVWSRGTVVRYQSHLHTVARPTCVVHPSSPFMFIWSIIGCCFMVCDMFFATMSAFGIRHPEAVLVVDCLYWAADVVVKFRTGITDNRSGLMQYQMKIICKSYLRGWFWFDVFLLTTQVIILSTSAAANVGFVRYFRIFRYMRLFRFAKLGRTIKRLMSDTYPSEGVNYAGQLLFCLLCLCAWIHTSACVWYSIGNTPDGWVSNAEAFAEMPTSYLISLHWAASQLQGGIDLYPNVDSVGERTFALVQLMGSVAVLATVVSRFTNVMAAMSASYRRRSVLMETARNFLERHEMSPDLRHRLFVTLRQVQTFHTLRLNSEAEDDMMARLPSNIRRLLLMEARWPVLKRHTVFRSFRLASDHFTHRFLCECITMEFHMSDDFIFRYGAMTKKIFILLSGDAFYMRMARVMLAAATRTTFASADSSLEDFQAHQQKLLGRDVVPNTLICEGALWTPWFHRGDFETRSNCTILSINVVNFVDLVESFPVVVQKLAVHANRFVKALMSLNEISDLIDSETVLQHEQFQLVRLQTAKSRTLSFRGRSVGGGMQPVANSPEDSSTLSRMQHWSGLRRSQGAK